MALLQAGLAAGTSLIGGMFGSKANSKAARDQFHYQDALDRNAFMYQSALQGNQNAEINRTNDRIERWNHEITQNHSTAETKTRTVDTRWNQTTSSAEDSATSTGSIDFARLVKDAEAAGFNPLTVLRAGGLAGYSTTNSTVRSNSLTRTTNGGSLDVHETHKPARELMTYFGHGEIPQASQAGQAPQVQPNGNPIGDALKAGFDAWSTFDRHANERAALERELARAQIGNFNSDTAANNRRFAIPSWTDTGQRSSAGGFGGAVRAALPTGSAGLGSIALPTVGEVKVTNPWQGWEVDPNTRDGSAFEERYAGLGDLLGGVNVGVADFKHNARVQRTKNMQYLSDTANSAWNAIKGASRYFNPTVGGANIYK